MRIDRQAAENPYRFGVITTALGFSVDGRINARGEETILVTISAIRYPKPNTWYYGVRCGCMRLLAVCEDLFAGKGDDEFLQVPAGFGVECACGRVSRVAHLSKFKTP